MARLNNASSVASIEQRLQELAARFPGICQLEAPPAHKSHGNAPGFAQPRQLFYLRIGKSVGRTRIPVLIVGGVHAREVAPPAILINLMEDLLVAYSAKPVKQIIVKRFVDKWRGNRIYPKFVIPSGHVRAFMEDLDLYFVPLANPDGRQFVLSDPLNRKWRKNRATNAAAALCAPIPASTINALVAGGTPLADIPIWFPNSQIGVDLNRNFDIAWDHKNFYASAALIGPDAVATSDEPCSLHQVFRGQSKASEPEVQFLQGLITDNKFPYFLDVHMHGRLILPPWSLETNQKKANIDSAKNYRNTAWDRLRDGSSGTAYEEYMPPGLLRKLDKLAKSMASQVSSVTANTASRPHSKYKARYSDHSRLNTGTAKDYAFSRTFEPMSTHPNTLSYTLECGHKHDGDFSPNPTRHYPKIEREAYAAIWAFLSSAAGVTARAGNASGSGTATPDDDCFIATAAFGSPAHRHVLFLKSVRDRIIKKTSLGRKFVHAVERVYVKFSPKLAGYLRGRSKLRAVTRNCIVIPVVFQIRSCVWIAVGIRNGELRVATLVGLLSALFLVHLGLASGIALLLFNFLLGTD